MKSLSEPMVTTMKSSMMEPPIPLMSPLPTAPFYETTANASIDMLIKPLENSLTQIMQKMNQFENLLESRKSSRSSTKNSSKHVSQSSSRRSGSPHSLNAVRELLKKNLNVPPVENIVPIPLVGDTNEHGSNRITCPLYPCNAEITFSTLQSAQNHIKFLHEKQIDKLLHDVTKPKVINTFDQDDHKTDYKTDPQHTALSYDLTPTRIITSATVDYWKEATLAALQSSDLGNEEISTMALLRSRNYRTIYDDIKTLKHQERLQFHPFLTALRIFMVQNNIRKDLLIEIVKNKTYSELSQYLLQQTQAFRLVTEEDLLALLRRYLYAGYTASTMREKFEIINKQRIISKVDVVTIFADIRNSQA